VIRKKIASVVQCCNTILFEAHNTLHNSMSAMATTCSIPCSRCNRIFKTSKSLKKHFLDRHQSTQWASSITFYDNDHEILIPSFEVATDVNGYKLWLSSLSERMLEALHPVLPGKIHTTIFQSVFV